MLVENEASNSICFVAEHLDSLKVSPLFTLCSCSVGLDEVPTVNHPQNVKHLVEVISEDIA